MPRMEAVAQRGGPRPDTSRMSAFSCPGGKAARYGQPAAEGPAAFDRRCILPAFVVSRSHGTDMLPLVTPCQGRPSPVSLQRGVLPRRPREQPGAVAASVPASAAPSAVSPAQQPPSTAASAELEVLFWQSIANSTNPAEFEAYLRRFPNGMFSELAQIRLEALRSPVNDAPASAGPADGRGGFAGYRVSGIRGWRRRAASSWRRFPGLRRVSGDGGAAWRRSGDGPLRGDGGGVSGVRVGDGGERATMAGTGGTTTFRRRTVIRRFT